MFKCVKFRYYNIEATENAIRSFVCTDTLIQSVSPDDEHDMLETCREL